MKVGNCMHRLAVALAVALLCVAVASSAPLSGPAIEEPASSTTSVMSDDTMATTLASSDADELKPSTDQGVAWMDAVNASVGFARDGSPHRLSKADSAPYSKTTWWTAPVADADGNVTSAQPTDMQVLSPVPEGDYELSAYCSGAGSFTISMVVDGQAMDSSQISCDAAMPASTRVPLEVDESSEQLSVTFVPSPTTQAAAGFFLSDRG